MATDSSSAPSGSVTTCCAPRLERELQRERGVGRAETRTDLVGALVDGERTADDAARTAHHERRRLARPGPPLGERRGRLGLHDGYARELDVPDGAHVEPPQLGPRCRLRCREETTTGERSSSTECQLTSLTCGGMLTSALPPTTRTSAVGDGLAMEQRHLEHHRGAHGREAHDAASDTCQSSPMSSVRSTRTNGGRTPGSSAPAAAPARIRVSCRLSSARPSSWMPSTRQPSVCVSTR